MTRVVALLDDAMARQNVAALSPLFATDAVFEVKPAGLRIALLDTALEMFRRTLPPLAPIFAARELSQTWANQNGIVREWFYPVSVTSGQVVRTRQLEIIEFAEDLGAIASYRLRMSLLYAKFFEPALGEDFASLPGITRVPR